MRIFLIIFSFINTFLYLLFYSYYDNIFDVFGNSNTSSGGLIFLKVVILIIIGFLISLIVSLFLKINIEKSFFDYKLFLIVGILPFIFLILSQGSITDFVIMKFFHASKQVSEMAFYFFSRQVVWSLWLGFAAGASVRIAFTKKLKHDANYYLIDNNDQKKLFK
jgi:hypothetical protein